MQRSVGLGILVAMLTVGGCSEPSAPVATRPATPAPTAVATEAKVAVENHGQGKDHDHGHDHGHDHADEQFPDTLPEAVEDMETLCVDVEDLLAGGHRDDADEKVHMAGHLIEHLRGMFSDSSLADDAKKSASAALDSLFDCFDTMDTALHATEEAKQKIDYTDHEPKIETAIGTLKDLAKSL